VAFEPNVRERLHAVFVDVLDGIKYVHQVLEVLLPLDAPPFPPALLLLVGQLWALLA
jgi:hypothetical protein